MCVLVPPDVFADPRIGQDFYLAEAVQAPSTAYMVHDAQCSNDPMISCVLCRTAAMESTRAVGAGLAAPDVAGQPAPAHDAGVAEVSVQPRGGITPAQRQHEGAAPYLVPDCARFPLDL